MRTSVKSQKFSTVTKPNISSCPTPDNIEPVTFEQLPEVVAVILQKITVIERLLQERSTSNVLNPNDQLLTVQQAAEFLKLAVPTIYSLVCRREIPFMKRSKRIYFAHTDLLEYVKSGRKKTILETKSEIDNSALGSRL